MLSFNVEVYRCKRLFKENEWFESNNILLELFKIHAPIYSQTIVQRPRSLIKCSSWYDVFFVLHVRQVVIWIFFDYEQYSLDNVYV